MSARRPNGTTTPYINFRAHSVEDYERWRRLCQRIPTANGWIFHVLLEDAEARLAQAIQKLATTALEKD